MSSRKGVPEITFCLAKLGRLKKRGGASRRYGQTTSTILHRDKFDLRASVFDLLSKNRSFRWNLEKTDSPLAFEMGAIW